MDHLEFFKKTWAEISLDAIRHNYLEVRKVVGQDTGIAAVVKADAYGHGAVPVARMFQQLGARYLAVSSLDEAMQLRAAGISAPILILGWTPPEHAEVLRGERITQAIFSLEQARALAEHLSSPADQPLLVHIKVDTGMSRLGFPACKESGAFIHQVNLLPGLKIEGIFTHFAVSDLPDDPFTTEQFQRFLETIRAAEALGTRFELRHCANSGAIIDFPETHLDMVRPGIILYGLQPDRKTLPFDLRPAMTFKTTVSQVHEVAAGATVSYGRTYRCETPRRIAVLCAGYADGLMRLLSGRLQFRIGEYTVPQVGRICMDMCMADVTGTDVESGDTAVIFGNDPTATDLAERIGTISYELVCQISKRVPRIYLQNGCEVGHFSYLHPEE